MCTGAIAMLRAFVEKSFSSLLHILTSPKNYFIQIIGYKWNQNCINHKFVEQQQLAVTLSAIIRNDSTHMDRKKRKKSATFKKVFDNKSVKSQIIVKVSIDL